MDMEKDKTIKVSPEAYKKLKDKKKATSMTIRFMVDRALEALWGKK